MNVTGEGVHEMNAKDRTGLTMHYSQVNETSIEFSVMNAPNKVGTTRLGLYAFFDLVSEL